MEECSINEFILCVFFSSLLGVSKVNLFQEKNTTEAKNGWFDWCGEMKTSSPSFNRYSSEMTMGPIPSQAIFLHLRWDSGFTSLPVLGWWVQGLQIYTLDVAPVTGTTRTITFSVQNPYINLHFPLESWEGATPNIYTVVKGSMAIATPKGSH